MIDFDFFGLYKYGKKVRAAVNRPTRYYPTHKDTWECQCCRRMKHANADRYKHNEKVICGSCADSY